MAGENVATEVADDDFDVSADLAAAFDAAEQETPVTAEPAGETAEQAAARARDDKGRFAKVEEPVAEPTVAKTAAAAEKPVAAVAAVAAQPAVDPAAPAGEIGKPPPGFSPTAKVVWDKEALDKAEWEAVKRDITKRSEEVERGFAKFAEYKPVERFMEMAKQSGTTLDRALENYVSIEQTLARDFLGGIARICQNQGVNPVALANQILARSGAAPSEGQAGDTQGGHQQPQGVDLSPVMQKISALENYINQQQSATVQTELERFASDPKHTFFANVRADMGRLMNSGYAEGLDDAYEKACWANPEIRGLLIKQQSSAAPDPGAKVAAANQARAAAKSITGSPIPHAANKGPETSLEDEIRQLMDASSV